MNIPKPEKLGALAILLGYLLLMSIQASEQRTDEVIPIEPPFGLEWGESPLNVKTWAQTNNFPATEGRLKDGRYAIEIEGPFPAAEFDRLRFYFSQDQLTETELQFIKTGPEDEGTSFTAINQAMALKNRIDRTMGRGHLIKNEEGNENGAKWRFIQQIWTDEEHSIWLALFTATEKLKGCLAITSLHYRWEKKLQEKVDKKTESVQ